MRLFDGRPVPHFDLVFMDIIMPRLDGVAASARIREWLPHAAIVAVTSNVRQEEIETYFQYGNDPSQNFPSTCSGTCADV